jgi:hypothetical protein
LYNVTGEETGSGLEALAGNILEAQTCDIVLSHLLSIAYPPLRVVVSSVLDLTAYRKDRWGWHITVGVV